MHIKPISRHDGGHPRRWLLAFRLLASATFFWAAYAKLAMPAGGPTIYEHWLSFWPQLRYIVPGIEAGLGLWLIIGIWPQASAIAAIAIVSGFSGLLVVEIGKSHPQPCGCMGTIAAAYDPQVIRLGLALGLGRNILIIVGASYLFLASRRFEPRANGAVSRQQTATEAESIPS